MPPKPSPLGFPPNRTLVQHSRKYAINYNRATLHMTLPMLIAKLYCTSNRRSIKIKRIVQKYAVRESSAFLRIDRAKYVSF